MPRAGTVRLLKAHCTTTSGAPVRVRVSATSHRTHSQGEARAFRVIRHTNGRTVLRTFGQPLKIRVVWRASAKAGDLGYKKTRTYRT